MLPSSTRDDTHRGRGTAWSRTRGPKRGDRYPKGAISVGLAVLALGSFSVNACPTAAQADPQSGTYRSSGFSFGVLQKQLTGSGAYEEYVEATDSYRMLPSDGRAMWGLSFGGHIWSQRTALQFEFARSGDQFLYEEPRSLLGGGVVDTFIYMQYTTLGFRLRQALITRSIMVNAGISWIEEGRKRESSAVATQTFPADVFPMWSWGVDLRLNRAVLLGFVRERSYDHFGDDLPTPIEGWTSNAIQLTLIF